MIEFLALLSTPFLSLPFVRRIRRNHGLEHATIHVLSRKIKNAEHGGTINHVRVLSLWEYFHRRDRIRRE